MPFFDYKCPECGYEIIDIYKQIKIDTSNSHHICHHCNSVMNIKYSRPPMFELKGNGWYETDYANIKTHKGEKNETR